MQYTDYSTKEIHHRKTAEYFAEVHSSYKNQNFRSAVVTLYSVVMADLIYKLQESFDIYEDNTAESILNEIRDKQQRNPSSSEWEQYLIDSIINRTKLLESHDGENLKHLRKHRHLCAHPVLDQADVLFSPNDETVLAHIKNMIEGVISKGALLKSNIFVDMVTSLENDKKYLTSEPVLSRYVESKYLKHFSFELEKKVFKSLWRVVFKLDDDSCERNRDINFKVLKIMMDRNTENLKSLISEEPVYFSQINDDSKIISYISRFLFNYSDVFSKLEAHAQELLRSHTLTDESKIIKAYYLSKTAPDHFKHLSKRYHHIEYNQFGAKYSIVNHSFRKEDIVALKEIAKRTQSFYDFYSLMIEHYSYSTNFDTASSIFDECITPFLEKFDENLMLQLLDGFNKNDQIYTSFRRFAKYESKMIKKHADLVLVKDFDYKQYPNFNFFLDE
ncbi:hypothetical protein BK124_00615 [Paenibacillus amylolyticus]|nr:hypothetical protein BK124_00615 [Paenibacillus amylolyticus]